ncbi:MAG: zinc chelation protein SecC, partial [Gammaproteobacteria bacterium]
LMRGYLEADELDKALALAERFPDDLCGIELGRILTLYRLGRLDAAQQALETTATDFNHAIKMLLAKNPKAPRQSGYGIARGSAEEAWEYRLQYLEQWRQAGALDWLRQAWRSIDKSVKDRGSK